MSWTDASIVKCRKRKFVACLDPVFVSFVLAQALYTAERASSLCAKWVAGAGYLSGRADVLPGSSAGSLGAG